MLGCDRIWLSNASGGIIYHMCNQRFDEERQLWTLGEIGKAKQLRNEPIEANRSCPWKD